MSCDTLCDYSHILLYYLRNKRKLKKIDKNKIKYKGLSILWQLICYWHVV